MQINKVELLLVISPDGLESTAIDPALVALEDSRNEKQEAYRVRGRV